MERISMISNTSGNKGMVMYLSSTQMGFSNSLKIHLIYKEGT